MSSPYALAVDNANAWLYVANLSAAQVRRYDLDGNLLDASGAGQLDDPVGLALRPDGRLYVAQLIGNVKLLSPGTPPNPSWGVDETFGGGDLSAPHAVAFDPSGYLYVGDEAQQVTRYQDLGSSHTRVSSTTSLSLAGIRGLVFAAGKLYYSGTNEIRRMDAATLTEEGAAAAVGIPRGIWSGALGHFFVASYSDKAFYAFDSAWSPLYSCGSGGTGTGQFDEPVGIVTDAVGRVYVGDTQLQRIQRFDPCPGTTPSPTPLPSSGAGPAAWIFPNPVRGAQASLRLRLGAPADLRLHIYNEAGHPVRDQPLGSLGAGLQTLALDLGDLAPGVHYFRLQTDTGLWPAEKFMVLEP